jgi:glycosyltransferase involved in cell wall biosynthesis
MHVGMLTDVYKPVVNGITNAISLCKREMEAAGHQVTVFTFGPQEDTDHESGVIRSSAIPIADTGYSLGLLYSREARESLRRMDVLHAHHPFLSGRMATRYGHQLNLPVLFTNHTRYDLYAKTYLPILPPALTHGVLEAFMPAFAALCDLVIAPSEGVEHVLRELGVNQEIVVIPNGIDLQRFDEPLATVPRSRFGIPDDALVVVYCGRLAAEKNLEFLLKAFRGVAQAVPDAYLLIVGSGPLEEHLHLVVSQLQRVVFAGAVSYQDVPAHLGLGDLFATASMTEVHPLSVIEATAAGLPVLAIESPGIDEIVRDGVDGLLVDDDLPTYTAMMVRLLMEPDRRAAMAVAARERSRQFDVRHTVALLLEQYERLAAEFRHRPPKETLWAAMAREVQQVFGDL